MEAGTIDYNSVLRLFEDELTRDLIDRQVDALLRVARVNDSGYLVRDIPSLQAALSVCLQALTDKGAAFVCPAAALIRVFARPYKRLRANEEVQHSESLAGTLCCIVEALFAEHEEVYTAAADTLHAFVTGSAFEAGPVREAAWTFHQDILRASGSMEQLVLAFSHHAARALTDEPGAEAEETIPPAHVHTMAVERAHIRRSPPLLWTIASTLLEASEDARTASILTAAGATNAVIQTVAILPDFRDMLVGVLLELAWNLAEHSAAAIDGAREPGQAAASLSELLHRHRTSNALVWLGSEDSLGVLAELLENTIVNGYTRADKELRNDVMVLLGVLARRRANRRMMSSSGLLQVVLTYSVAPEMRTDVPAPVNNFGTTSEEDLEFKQLAWHLIAALSDDDAGAVDTPSAATSTPGHASHESDSPGHAPACADQIRNSLFIPALLMHVDPLQRGNTHPYLGALLSAQRRAFELEALRLLALLAHRFAENVLACDGLSILTLYLRAHAENLQPTMAAQAVLAATDAMDGKEDEIPPGSVMEDQQVDSDPDPGRAYAAMRALSALCGAGVSSARLPPASDIVHTMPPAAEQHHASSRSRARDVGIRTIDMTEAKKLCAENSAESAVQNFLHGAVDSALCWASHDQPEEPLGLHVSAVLGELGLVRDMVSVVSATFASTESTGVGRSVASLTLTGTRSGTGRLHPSQTAEGRGAVAPDAVCEAALCLLADLTRGAADVALHAAAKRVLGDVRENDSNTGEGGPEWQTPTGHALGDALVDRLRDNQKRIRRAGGIPFLSRMLKHQADIARRVALPEAADSSATMPHTTLALIAALRCATAGSAASAGLFIASAGINSLLDLLEVAPPAVLSPGLCLLADTCSHPAAGVCVRAWRSERNGATAARLMLDLWIQEEKRLGVPRAAAAGAIVDGARPLGGAVPRPPRSATAADAPAPGAAFKPLRRALAAARKWHAGDNAPVQVHARVLSTDLRPKLFAVLSSFGLYNVEEETLDTSGLDGGESKLRESELAMGTLELQADLAHTHHVVNEVARVFPGLLLGTAWLDVRARLEAAGVELTQADAELLENHVAELAGTVAATRAAQKVHADAFVEAIETEQRAFAATTLAPKDADPRAAQRTVTSAAGDAKHDSETAAQLVKRLANVSNPSITLAAGASMSTQDAALSPRSSRVTSSVTSMDERRIITEAKQAMLSKSLIGYKPRGSYTAVLFQSTGTGATTSEGERDEPEY